MNKSKEAKNTQAIAKTDSPENLSSNSNNENERVEIAVNSLEANIGYGSLLRELQRAYSNRVAFYRSEAGGFLSPDEARAKAYHPCKDMNEVQQILDKLMSYPLDTISFISIAELVPVAPRIAEDFWELMKHEAGKEFESGHLASKHLLPLYHKRTAWNVASYLGMRESFIADWQPKGAIELSLIDMLAQSFLQYQFWLEQSVIRSQSEPRGETYEYKQWKKDKSGQLKAAKCWTPGHWDVPYVHEQEAIEHAAQMVDRWNKIYMRTLRNLRDLRRYTPQVTINNPQQVNIAADGGQQINVANENNEIQNRL